MKYGGRQCAGVTQEETEMDHECLEHAENTEQMQDWHAEIHAEVAERASDESRHQTLPDNSGLPY